MSLRKTTVTKPTAGSMMRFLEKYDLEHQKMKREEGSDKYAAIQPWITDWVKRVICGLSLI